MLVPAKANEEELPPSSSYYFTSNQRATQKRTFTAGWTRQRSGGLPSTAPSIPTRTKLMLYHNFFITTL